MKGHKQPWIYIYIYLYIYIFVDKSVNQEYKLTKYLHMRGQT